MDSWGYKLERPKTIPFDYSYAKGSDDLPLDRPPLAKTASEVEPEQIHIALAGVYGFPFKVVIISCAACPKRNWRPS